MVDDREALFLRVSPELKRDVEAFARRLGVSLNAAAIVLLDRGLSAERQRDKGR